VVVMMMIKELIKVFMVMMALIYGGIDFDDLIL